MQIPESVRKLLGIATSILAAKPDDFFTAKEAVHETDWNKTTVYRNLRKALKYGWVECLDETKKRNRKYVMGTPIEDDRTVFPSPDKLKEKLNVSSQDLMQPRNVNGNSFESLKNIVSHGPATNKNDCHICNQQETDKPLVAAVADQSGSCSRSCNQNYQENQQVKPLVALLHDSEGSELNIEGISSRQGLPCESIENMGDRARLYCSACEGPCLSASDPELIPAPSEVKPTKFNYKSDAGRIRIE